MAIINLYEDPDYGWTVMDDTGLIHPCQNFDDAIEKIREIGRRFKSGCEPDKVMLPKELTAENGAKYLMSGEFKEEINMPCYPCNEDGQKDTCELCGGHGEYTEKVVISWTTIKDIYRKVVDHYTK